MKKFAPDVALSVECVLSVRSFQLGFAVFQSLSRHHVHSAAAQCDNLQLFSANPPLIYFPPCHIADA